MVISGRGSDRDIVQALEVIKQKQWEQTHEVPKNKEGSPSNTGPSFAESTYKVWESVSQVVPETD